LAALVGSGLDAQPFTFFGFLPRSGRRRRELIAQLAALDHTAVIFESPQRLVDTLEEFAGQLGPDRDVVVARELTKIHEEFVRGTLLEVAAYYREHTPLGEMVVCLAAAPEVPPEELEGAAREQARALAEAGATSKEIVSALRERHGIDRNRAYAIALELTQENRN
jgi:16S rRNA (cytidine1402-2'-O)-methyltransferase